jgi:hypothetical protein
MTVRTRALAALLTGVALAAGSAAAAHAADPPAPLGAEQAARDARILERALRELHPALTKYQDQASVDAAFARFQDRARSARSAGAMYLAASELAAAIRCGHTWTNVLNQSGASKATLFDARDKLPLLLELVDRRWLVTASTDPAVAAGDEVLAIDEVPAAAMVARLLPYLRADGSSDGKRLRQLSHGRGDYSQMDILWPLLSPPDPAGYRLALRNADGDERDITVAATTLADRAAALAAAGHRSPDPAWRFTIDGDTGLLVLPTFSFWNSQFDWSAFLDDAFDQLRTGAVPNLVIDIRANEGGDGAIGNRLLAHLLRAPLDYMPEQSISAYERVPYALARYLDTWNFDFFDRTGLVEPVTDGPAAGSYRLMRASEERRIDPVPQPYAGRTFLLVGPENSSATFALARLAQRAGAATLVGQRTGGNQRGLNGGELAWVTLPNSGVAVDIPLLAAAWTAQTPDASVDPEIAVPASFDDRRAGRDTEMEAVRRLIRARSAAVASDDDDDDARGHR